MAQQIINVGAAPNDGQGDPIRTAFTKTNDNFGELYSRVQTEPPATLVGSIGDAAGMTAYDSDFYYYCFQDYDGSSIIWNKVPQAANAQVTTLTATGNITGAYFTGNGAGLTDVPAGAPTSVVNGTSNIIIENSGNITFSANSVSNIVLFTDVGLLANGSLSPGEYINGFLSAQGNINGTNIRARGAGNVPGNVLSDGNIQGGNIISNAVLQGVTLDLSGNIISDVTAEGNITIVGNLAVNGSVNGDISISGNATAGNLIATVDVIATNNVLATNDVIATGNVSGSFLIGDGGFISNVTAASNVAVTQIANGTSIMAVDGSGGNITITVGGTSNIAVFSTAGANVIGYVSATGNIDAANLTSAGRILSTGNVTGGNLTTGGKVDASGNIEGLNLNADQQVVAVGNITGANLITTGLISATGNITGGNISTAGTVTATGNITGGNLITSGSLTSTSFVATGNITGGNLISNAAISAGTTVVATGNISGGNLISNAAISAGTTIVATGNITGGNLLSGGLILVTGNIEGGNIVTGGRVLSTGNVTGGNLTTGGLITTTANVESANLVTTGSLFVNSTGAATAIVNSGSNGVGNIGSASSYFNRVFATSTSALYADLAECYLADADYPSGTVLCFGGSAEVTESVTDRDARVIGVVSTKPAYQMNSGLSGNHVVAVALMGRVPVRVTGKVRRGDMMVSNGDGRARAEPSPIIGTVIGKSLEDFDGEDGVIEVVVGRL